MNWPEMEFEMGKQFWPWRSVSRRVDNVEGVNEGGRDSKFCPSIAQKSTHVLVRWEGICGTYKLNKRITKNNRVLTIQ